LTYGGVNIIDPKLFNPPSPIVLDLLKSNAAIRVHKLTTPIDQYNRFADVPVSVPTDDDYQIGAVRFVLPASYKKLNIIKYTEAMMMQDIEGRSRGDMQERVIRHDEEMEWFLEHRKQDMLRTLVYIADTLENSEIPWGVGRGSSISSYILYLIGVHDIDPVEYDLDWREFLRDETE
jgi:Bacterial DNA polymerase III alpha NTPase domain